MDEIEHPMVRNAMRFQKMEELFISYDADLPARSGLGSSSFAVGLLNAFHALKGQCVSKEQLSREAIHVERVLCAEEGGWQDQIVAAYGGINRINFGANGFEVAPVIIQPERRRQLNRNLLMLFTGFSRLSSEIEKDKARAVKANLGQLQEMKRLVDEGEAVLTDRHGDLDEFGRLLHYAWRLKRGISSKASTEILDEIYQRGYRQINVITSKKGALRGGHYHKENEEAFYIISGELEITVNGQRQLFHSGDFFDIERNDLHSFYFLQDTVLVSMYSNGVELPDGSKDIFTEYFSL